MLYPVFVQCLLSAVDHPLVSAQRMTRHQFRYVSVIFHNQKASNSRDWTPPALRSAPAKMLRKGSQYVSHLVKFPGVAGSEKYFMYTSICSKHFQSCPNTIHMQFLDIFTLLNTDSSKFRIDMRHSAAEPHQTTCAKIRPDKPDQAQLSSRDPACPNALAP